MKTMLKAMVKLTERNSRMSNQQLPQIIKLPPQLINNLLLPLPLTTNLQPPTISLPPQPMPPASPSMILKVLAIKKSNAGTLDTLPSNGPEMKNHLSQLIKKFMTALLKRIAMRSISQLKLISFILSSGRISHILKLPGSTNLSSTTNRRSMISDSLTEPLTRNLDRPSSTRFIDTRHILTYCQTPKRRLNVQLNSSMISKTSFISTMQVITESPFNTTLRISLSTRTKRC